VAEKKNIYETIHAVMEDVGAIGKDKRNTQQNFMYRGVDDVMNALNPAFIKHCLFIVPEVLEHTREERVTGKGNNLIYSVCRVKYTFYAEDGSYVEAVVTGEGMDSGDKASNKAMSVAFKYACFQVFCIPTEEMGDTDTNPVDPDLDSHEPSEQLATDAMRQTFISECKRIGKQKSSILKAMGIPSLEKMTVRQFQSAMTRFENTPTKAADVPDPNTAPPEGEDSGLPWNTPGR